MYDVFISHCNENRTWVKVLADNLMRCGLEASFDHAGLIPGKPIAGQRYDALWNSRHGIFLVTPEALESGWAQDEYEAMQVRQKTEPGFRIIALSFTATPKLPFLGQNLCVDFADPSAAAYESGFRQILRELRGLPPDAPLDLTVELEIPPPPVPRLASMATRPLAQSEEDFLGAVFTALKTNGTAMLLAPADRDRTPTHRAILAEAYRRFGADNTLHLVPLARPDADKGEYLSYLGNQIVKGRLCHKSSDFEFLLADCLDRGKSMFLFITRMEEGSASGRRALSHALRDLNERYSDWLKIVLCGGENLLELRFKEGHLSPLHKAETLLWPEPSMADILDWQGSAGSLTEQSAAILLRLTGGNGRLIQRALQMQPATPADLAAVAEKLRQDAILRARFSAYREDGNAERVASLLKRDDLGRYEPWPVQALLRRLYWEGLLVEQEGRFRWRCELIRLIGRQVLGA